MAESAAAVSKTLATAKQYNDLRNDTLSITLGHVHDGTNARGNAEFILAVVGRPLTLANTTNGVSNQVGILESRNTTRAANDEIYQSNRLANSAGTQTEFVRQSFVATTVTAASEVGAMDIALMDAGTLRSHFRFQRGHIRFDRGAAVTAADYSVGRDADATNQLHLNVPTGATFEFSVNDTPEFVFSATQLDLSSNNLVGVNSATITGTTGNTLVVKTNVLVVDATNNRVGIRTAAPAIGALHVVGSLHVNNTTDAALGSTSSGVLFAKEVTVTGGAGATTIKASTGSEGSVYVVAGASGVNRFVDLVLYGGTTSPSVVASVTAGTPATRTYTRSAETLQLALSGTDAYTVSVTGMGSSEN